MRRKWLFRSPDALSHPEIHFVLGQFRPSTKRLKNPPVHHRPEATGSVYRIMFSDVEHLCQPISWFYPTILSAPRISRPPSFSTQIHRCRFHATTIAPIFFPFLILFLPVSLFVMFQEDEPCLLSTLRPFLNTYRA